MKAEATFTLIRGTSPLVVSMPHVGTCLPDWLKRRLTEEALALSDTDWYLDELYDFLEALDATIIIATHSRYVIDLNRPLNDANLYPGQNSTGLCPKNSFSQKPLYLKGLEPSTVEISSRISGYWQPYHDALADELVRIKLLHGKAMLWDAHSICSYLPRFFDGELPNLSIGTADNQSCAASLTQALELALAKFPQYSYAINGRFKGGYITRRYGQPEHNTHAVQLEIAMRSYMQETTPYRIDRKRSLALRPVLLDLLNTMVSWEQT